MDRAAGPTWGRPPGAACAYVRTEVGQLGRCSQLRAQERVPQVPPQRGLHRSPWVTGLSAGRLALASELSPPLWHTTSSWRGSAEPGEGHLKRAVPDPSEPWLLQPSSLLQSSTCCPVPPVLGPLRPACCVSQGGPVAMWEMPQGRPAGPARLRLLL